MSQYIDKSEIEQLSIVDFLARLGYRHKFKSGPEYFYHSMLRGDDHSPSFSVNDAKGVWMDRGSADPHKLGGNIIHLGNALWPALSFPELLLRIRETVNGGVYPPDAAYVPHQRDEPVPSAETYQFALWDVRDIGHYQPITDYLDSRGLLETAEGRLFEVYYRDLKQPERQLPFFGVGWLNEHGNYEFGRLNGFKSSIGRKGISVIPGNPDHARVFEGYFDYLSRLRYYPDEAYPPTVIVLNAVNMLVHALDRLSGFQQIDIFVDRDGPGRACAGALQDWLPWAVDRSGEYEGFKDYNEKLKSDLGLGQDDRNTSYPISR